MRLRPFKLERYFARWEFSAPYLLCSSDVEGYPMAELLALADEECRELWRDLKLGYTESPGLPLLRAEVARLYERVDADEVLMFAGAEEAIFVTLNALLAAGDHAIVTWPAYQSLLEVGRGTGAAVEPLPLEEHHQWELDLDALRERVRPETRLIVVNFPHNPTGALIDRQRFEAVVAMARDAGCWLLSDEVYRGLEHDPALRLPAAVDLYERAISLGVMSKTYALAGLRIGWIATHDAEVLSRAVGLKDYTTICNSAPSEILALIALRARERVVARSLGIIERNLPLLDRFFERWGDLFTWVRPRAGCIAFPRLLADTSVEQFAADLVEREGVLLLPGSVFDAPGNNFRLGFGRTNMSEALGRLERFLKGWDPR